MSVRALLYNDGRADCRRKNLAGRGALAGELEDLDGPDFEDALVGAEADHGRVAQRPLRLGGAADGGGAPALGPRAGEERRDAVVPDPEDRGVRDAVFERGRLPDEGRAF